VPANAANIVCPPQNHIVSDFDKWSADYSRALAEVWLNRQFLKDQEGATIRCKRTLGSVQIMLREKSCRIIPGTGKVQTTPFGNAEETLCTAARTCLRTIRHALLHADKQRFGETGIVALVIPLPAPSTMRPCCESSASAGCECVVKINMVARSKAPGNSEISLLTDMRRTYQNRRD
jgi:hypothetical protein